MWSIDLSNYWERAKTYLEGQSQGDIDGARTHPESGSRDLEDIEYELEGCEGGGCTEIWEELSDNRND